MQSGPEGGVAAMSEIQLQDSFVEDGDDTNAASLDLLEQGYDVLVVRLACLRMTFVLYSASVRRQEGGLLVG